MENECNDISRLHGRELRNTPESELLRLGFSVVPKPLSVGGARVLARVDLAEQTVYLDIDALGRYAQEQGASAAQMRQQVLAHELGHVLHPDLRGSAAERAAQEFAESWRHEAERAAQEFAESWRHEAERAAQGGGGGLEFLDSWRREGRA